MSGLSESPAWATRMGMLRQAARILLVSLLGWSAGAAVIWQFGSGAFQSDVGLLVVGAALWAAIPLSVLRVLRSRAGSPQTERPRTWGIWFVLAALSGSAIIGIVRPLMESWSSLQIWSAIFLLTPVGIALDTVPRIIRPAGWTSVAAGARKAIPVTLLALALVVFSVAAGLGEGVLRSGRMTGFEDAPLSLIGTEVAVVAAVLSLVVVLAFVVGLPLVAFGGIGLLFAGFSILVQFAWLPVVGGVVEVDAPALLALHVAAALAVIVATAVVQVFRQRDASATETALVDWLRAEAVLPEKPAVEGSATG